MGDSLACWWTSDIRVAAAGAAAETAAGDGERSHPRVGSWDSRLVGSNTAWTRKEQTDCYRAKTRKESGKDPLESAAAAAVAVAVDMQALGTAAGGSLDGAEDQGASDAVAAASEGAGGNPSHLARPESIWGWPSKGETWACPPWPYSFRRNLPDC